MCAPKVVCLRIHCRFSTSSGEMWTKQIRFSSLLLLVFGLAMGCNKSGSHVTPSAPRPLPNEPIISLHWAGIKHVSADPNATGFLKIWRMPETEKLKAQTLDKLALAPWRFHTTNRLTSVTNYAMLLRDNASASQLRPLLDDLVQNECYLEIREAQDDHAQLGLAVHLDPTRAAIWESSLGSVLEAATGARRVPAQTGGKPVGWHISAGGGAQISPLLKQIELTRSGDWTILGFGSGDTVFSNFVHRVRGSQTPFNGSGGSAWLLSSFDLPRANRALSWGWDLPQQWPRVSLAWNGNGQNVITKGVLTFAKPVPFQIEPWIIPTNIIHEPLHSFAAVQGIQPWLASWRWWRNLNTGTAPNQLFCWSQSGSPFLDYAAAPAADPGKIMAKLGPSLMDTFNPELATNRMGKWERRNDTDGVAWSRAPIIAPMVHSISLPSGHFLLAGLSPLALTNAPPPSGTLRELLSLQNVVYFDRELTGPRVEAWMYISQLFRIIMRRAQLAPEARALNWLKAISPSLAASATTLFKTSPTEMTFERTSSIGFTAVELHLLADWFESPEFPLSLHTVVAKYPPLPERRVPGQTPAPSR